MNQTTTAHSPKALALSALLHAGAVALVLFFSREAALEQSKKAPKILELVAGEGNNYMATAAPALGREGGVKLALPKSAPAPELPRPEPERPTPAPVTKAEPVTPPPTTKATATPIAPAKAEPKQRTIAQNLRRQLIIADSKAKRQVAKEREAEQKRISKEEFDKAQKAKAAAKPAPSKIEKIDSEGIAKGVIGGSTANKVGGAGGNALTVAERSEADAYAALLNQRLTNELDQISGLEDGLKAEAEFEVLASGRLARGKIIRSSRNERFDAAVLHAIAAVRIGVPPPKGFERVQQVTFSSHGHN